MENKPGYVGYEADKRPLHAVFCADEQNDLILALRYSGYQPKLAKTAEEALNLADAGDAVFILASGYPAVGTTLHEKVLADARKKQVKLFIEYPEYVLGKETDEPRTIVYERLVAVDGFLVH